MAWPAGGSSGIKNNVSTPRILATDSVKWTGEGVAAVVAETPEQAQDALEAIVVDWAPLAAVVDAEAATKAGAPQLHENAPNNVVFEWNVGDKGGTEAALKDADVVIRQRLVNHRLIPNPMETRGDIGWYNPGTDEYTIWMSSQTPHIQRLLLAAFVMGVPEHKIRCISPDVGGAFGTKIFCYADMALVLFASKLVGGRPGKWVEGRRESFQSTIHGRDHITYLEIAAKKDGTVTGLKVKTYANLGGRLSTIGPGIPTTLYARVLSGCYKIPNVYAEVTGVYTNTTFVDAYRGAGRPEATYVVERTMDLVADELGLEVGIGAHAVAQLGPQTVGVHPERASHPEFPVDAARYVGPAIPSDRPRTDPCPHIDERMTGHHHELASYRVGEPRRRADADRPGLRVDLAIRRQEEPQRPREAPRHGRRREPARKPRRRECDPDHEEHGHGVEAALAEGVAWTKISGADRNTVHGATTLSRDKEKKTYGTR